MRKLLFTYAVATIIISIISSMLIAWGIIGKTDMLLAGILNAQRMTIGFLILIYLEIKK